MVAEVDQSEVPFGARIHFSALGMNFCSVSVFFLRDS